MKTRRAKQALHATATAKRRRRPRRGARRCAQSGASRTAKAPARGGERFFGLVWDRQSCWMDSSFMSLFFPDRMHAVMFPYIKKCTRHNVAEAKQHVVSAVQQLRAPGKTSTLRALRQHLLEFQDTEDQRSAFQPDNVFGYVFYFVQEFLRLFDFPPLVARRVGKAVQVSQRLPHARRRNLKLYIVEVEFCKGETVEKCLEKNYRGWTFDRCTLRYLIIELISHNVKPQLTLEWQGVRWQLQSMIVFDCSHFVAYMRRNDIWYLHDDSRTLQKIPITEYEFGDYYQRGMCHFQYGVKNTFFFYTPQ